MIKKFAGRKSKRSLDQTRLISLGILSLAGTFSLTHIALADNLVQINQNNSGLGGLLGGVGGVLQNTTGGAQNLLGASGSMVGGVVGSSTQALGRVVGGAAGAMGPVGGTLNSVMSPVGGSLNSVMGPVGGSLTGTLNSVNSTLNNIPSNVGGAFSPVNSSLNSLMNQPILNQVDSRASITGINRNLNSNIAPTLVAPIFKTPDLNSMRGLNVINAPLIGSSLQNIATQNVLLSGGYNAQFKESSAGNIELSSGKLLVSLPAAKSSVLVNTPVGKVWIGKQANVLVSYQNNVLRIHNLDSIGQNVRLLLDPSATGQASSVLAIRPGFELLASKHSLSLDLLRPADGIARRNQILSENNRVAISEIHLATLIKNEPILNALRNSTASERRIFDRVIKTAAVLDMTRGRAGFIRNTVANGTTAVREVTGVVVNAARETTNQLLASLPGGGGTDTPPPVIPPVPPPTGTTPGGNTGTLPAGTTASSGTVASDAANIQASTAASNLGTGAAGTALVPTDQTRIARNIPINAEARQASKKASKGTLRTISENTLNPEIAPERSKQDSAKLKEEPGNELYGPAELYGPHRPSSGAGAAANANSGLSAGTEARKTRQNARNVSDTPEKGTPVEKALSSAKENIRRFPEFVLAAALIIAALLVLTIALARAAFLRARQLEAVNKRLANEINERRSIEQRATTLNEDLELRLQELAQLNQDLESARDQALEGSRLKSEFVANISHEIRTPISAVIGMNQLMMNTKLDEKQRDYARLVNESAQSLLTVINDILDFSKIEAGKLEVHSVAFSLDAVIKEVADMLASSVQEKGLMLFTFVDSSVNNTFRGDPARLRQVLLNLAGNAVKFTSSGEVVIHARSVRDESGKDRVRFTVEDSGIGISEDAQTRLFQPFVQADGSTTRRYGGTGLGLSISKHLVELMGGQIHVESKMGKGSMFWFELPGWTIPASLPETTEAAAPATKNVLLISSLQYSPLAISEHLSSAGFQTKLMSHANKRSLKSALKEMDYNAIIVDQTLADALAKVMNENESWSKIPVLFIRSSDAIKPPPDLHASCVTSPLTERDLLRWTVSLSRGEVQEKAESVEIQSEISPTPELAFANTSILVAEDSTVLQRMVKQLLEKLGCHVEIVSNGKEAVEAVNKNDYNIIFMDWQMPEMDGLEATRNIREIEAGSGKHIPIIAMTANAMQGDKDTCLAAGMDGYMSKPFRMDDLKAIINQYATSKS